MTEQNPDTVTPLDGDDGNVTGVAEQFGIENVQSDDYKTRGQTTVATRHGYAVVPSNKDLPVVTSAGVKMTKEEADAVVAESNDRAFLVPDTENQED